VCGLFGVIALINLPLLEAHSHYLVYKRKRVFKIQLEKSIAVVFFGLALTLCVYDRTEVDSRIIYWGFDSAHNSHGAGLFIHYKKAV
jgi:hypothetical protein